jgi:hypothetical protein
MKIYKVQSTNMDIQDGIFSNGYFMHKRHAEDILKGYASSKDGNNVVEDLEGKLETYDDKYGPIYVTQITATKFLFVCWVPC